jgi:hypothetical protein
MQTKSVLCLTERDLLILRWVGASGIASLPQLARRYWPAATRQTAQARLTQLREAGYLISQWRMHRGQSMQTYALTHYGVLQLPSVVQERVQAGWPGRLLVTQQLLANDAQIAIETALSARGARLVDWRSARELQRDYAREAAKARREGRSLPSREIPDAQMLVQEPEGRRVVVDIEIDGQYHGAMLASKARRYGTARRPLLWVCTQTRAERVARAIKPYGNITLLQLQDLGR